jgi:hypothetical protein
MNKGSVINRRSFKPIKYGIWLNSDIRISQSPEGFLENIYRTPREVYEEWKENIIEGSA